MSVTFFQVILATPKSSAPMRDAAPLEASPQFPILLGQRVGTKTKLDL